MKKLIIIIFVNAIFLLGCTQEEIIYFEDENIFESVYDVDFDDFEMYYEVDRPLVGHTQEKYRYDQGPITIDRAEEVFINYLDGLGWIAKEREEEERMFNQINFENGDYDNDLIMYAESRSTTEVVVFLEFPHN